ncbi:hypothetical protein KIPB_007572 [Kipferlia bialata]|uniref:Uncharacterized protein n=1 Tax=Kipferlia bialata TaxID=797122 RepID=A0A9K3D087_9EUKA|nr:hypothetical protein KIPB_007572 [Kipferlia bialata]|eukprot:g7572.t1
MWRPLLSLLLAVALLLPGAVARPSTVTQYTYTGFNGTITDGSAADEQYAPYSDTFILIQPQMDSPTMVSLVFDRFDVEPLFDYLPRIHRFQVYGSHHDGIVRTRRARGRARVLDTYECVYVNQLIPPTVHITVDQAVANRRLIRDDEVIHHDIPDRVFSYEGEDLISKWAIERRREREREPEPEPEPEAEEEEEEE